MALSLAATFPRLDALDLTRFGALVLAVAELSRWHDVRVRWLPESRQWLVTTRVEKHPAACDCGHCPRARIYHARGASPLEALAWARNDLTLIVRGAAESKARRKEQR